MKLQRKRIIEISRNPILHFSSPTLSIKLMTTKICSRLISFYCCDCHSRRRSIQQLWLSLVFLNGDGIVVIGYQSSRHTSIWRQERHRQRPSRHPLYATLGFLSRIQDVYNNDEFRFYPFPSTIHSSRVKQEMQQQSTRKYQWVTSWNLERNC